MYVHADAVEEYLKNDPKKPYLSCEYMHAMGNSVGNMDEYTALERYPHYQGGFVWDFIDQAILARQSDGSERLCYGGDFGDRPSDYEFSGNGLVFADRRPTPKAQEVKQLYANVHLDVTESGVVVFDRWLRVRVARAGRWRTGMAVRPPFRCPRERDSILRNRLACRPVSRGGQGAGA